MRAKRSSQYAVSGAALALDIGVEHTYDECSFAPKLVPAPQRGSPVEQLREILAGYNFSRGRVRLARYLILATDLAVLWAVFFLSRAAGWLTQDVTFLASFTSWWHNAGPVRLTMFAAISVGMVLWFWAVLGHYTRQKPYWDEIREMLLVLVAGFCIDAMLVFLGKWSFSRLWLLTTWGSLLFLLPMTRLLVRRWINSRGLLHQPYVIIGCGQEAIEAVAALESEPLMGFRPVALIRSPDSDCKTTECSIRGRRLPNFELDDELEAFLKMPSGMHIVVVLENGSSEALKALAQRLTLKRDDVFIVPSLNGLPLYGMELSHFFSHEVLLLRARNNLNRRGARLFKRACDIVGASLLLLLLSPFLIAVAIMIRRENGGPVIFSQPRVGYDGHQFRFLKFRSMVVNADAVLENWKNAHPELWERYCANNFKLADDPRVTKIGRFIRRTSIDELPQLWNVLRGDMSLVGPRPLLPRELGEYGESIDIYGNVRPGITGLWQISGRSTTTFEQRIAMDRWYIRNWSLWYDLVILIRTVRVVLRSDGAY